MEVGHWRIEIPDPMENLFSSNRFRTIVERFHSILGNNFDFDCPTRIKLKEQQILIYELKCRSFEKRLLHTIRAYFTAVRKMYIDYYLCPTIAVYSPQCFTNEIISAHQSIPLGAIYFGNIQGGALLSHWEVSFKQKKAAAVHQNSCGAHNKEATNKFAASFYYDQSDVLCITFENPEDGYVGPSPERSSPKRMCAGTGFYEILVRLSSIRRIIADVASFTSDKNTYGHEDRIHFELGTPAMIRRRFVPHGQDTNRKAYQRRDRWLQIYRGRCSREVPHRLALVDSPFFTIQFQAMMTFMLHEILSRLRMRSGIAIEFGHFEIVDVPYFVNSCPYSRWTGNKANINHNAATSFEDDIFKDFLAKTVRIKDTYDTNKYSSVVPWAKDIQREREFELTYLIEGLISRGAVVKDQILLDQNKWQDFLSVVCSCYRRNREVCLLALERTMTMLDEGRKIGYITLALVNEFEELSRSKITAALTKDEYNRGYRRVRKVVITPTRIIYVVPETLMANRVIRGHDHDGTRILRVVFRDDDNHAMRSFKTGNYLIKETLRSAMLNGIVIAGRSFGYLGNSNSQMRDGGAYFMEKYSHHDYIEHMRNFGQPPPLTYQPKIEQVRTKLGYFTNLENIYKLMARLGQCFTQSKQCDVPFKRSDYIVVPDIIGGSDSRRDFYTFSDGVGMISENFARQVAADMLLRQYVPSCYQFRFRGMKGVLAINPMLDEIALWAHKNGIISPPNNMFGNSSWMVKMVFRESQLKFTTTRKEKEAIEIVKYSSPSTVALNKPFICILDQVSEMQSSECHARVTNRIEELAEQQLKDHARSLLYEKACRNKLKELPQRICIDRLPEYAGFALSTEPFFRSLVKAMANYCIVRQMRKQQFLIPANKGRTMLGVIDDTGQLQYGQIFVQYTENITVKCPPPSARRRVVTGKVMLTKSPSVVAGDVRVFTAVDIPDLHHLCDVVVFPQHGPRPHSDEMAGSDLDGDEYAVIWDEDLMLDRSEPAFDYTSEKPKNIPIDPNTMNDQMVSFYCNYLTHDSIGTIANSFQFQADYYGINSKVCNSLAQKHAQAVDFPKTGCPPLPLSTDWSGDGEPPEKPERQPDFHLSYESSKAIYRSERLLGRIYRNFRTIDDVFKASQDIEKDLTVEFDPYLTVDGWKENLESAMAELQRYNGLLRGIIENYGIKTEAEAFSGCIIDIRNRISDREQDDMSFYTTNEVIDRKITNLFRVFREEFFREFGGWRNCLKSVVSPNASSEDVLEHYIANPPRCMQKKAVACYRACYYLANKTGELLLSFAWIAYDVLAAVKLTNVVDDPNFCPAMSPVFEVLEDRLINFFSKHKEKIKEFAERISSNASHLSRYLKAYTGLEGFMYLIVSWAEKNDLFTGSLRSEHLCLILLLFATGRIAGSVNIAEPLLDILDSEEVREDDVVEPTNEKYTKMVINFFEYLASGAFKKLPHLSLNSVGSNSIFLRGQWIPIHEAAVKTYYTMIFNMDFDEIVGDNLSTRNTLSRECEPFVVDLPGNEYDSQDDLLKKKLMEKTGVTSLSLRRLPGRQRRVAICARGSCHSLRLLRNLVTIKPIKTVIGEEISDLLPRLVYRNIMS